MKRRSPIDELMAIAASRDVQQWPQPSTTSTQDMVEWYNGVKLKQALKGHQGMTIEQALTILAPEPYKDVDEYMAALKERMKDIVVKGRTNGFTTTLRMPVGNRRQRRAEARKRKR